jgi:hypothetical protein
MSAIYISINRLSGCVCMSIAGGVIWRPTCTTTIAGTPIGIGATILLFMSKLQ